MADAADIANDRAEVDTGRAIAASARPRGPASTGYCLNCGPDVPLPDGLRWCDADCRDDWQRAQR